MLAMSCPHRECPELGGKGFSQEKENSIQLSTAVRKTSKIGADIMALRAAGVMMDAQRASQILLASYTDTLADSETQQLALTGNAIEMHPIQHFKHVRDVLR